MDEAGKNFIELAVTEAAINFLDDDKIAEICNHLVGKCEEAGLDLITRGSSDTAREVALALAQDAVKGSSPEDIVKAARVFEAYMKEEQK